MYCKDTIKSNTRQTFSGKSYIKAYYLTFLNIKIKYYYYFAYYLWYYYYYILYVSYYITYLIIYKEQKQTGKEGKKRKRNRRERGTGQRMPPPSSPVPRLSSVPSAASPSAPSPAAHPLTLTTSHQQPEREEGRAPRPVLGDAIATTSPPTGQQPTEGRRLELSAILSPLSTLPGCLGIRLLSSSYL